MPTTHARLARESCEAALSRTPAFGAILAGRLEEIRSGVHPGPWVDAVFQKGQDGRPDIYDAFAFHVVMSLLNLGKLAILAPPVGGGPGGDRDEDLNNDTLANLPRPFSARFHGGSKQDGDGVLTWDSPALFRWCPEGFHKPEAFIAMPPSEVVLEVGTTSSSKTLAHLIYEDAPDYCGLARWPYGNKVVTILRRVPKWLQVQERGWAVEDSPNAWMDNSL